MKRIIILFTLLFFATYSYASLPDSCKINMGTNLSGITDWSVEVPFVDVMHQSRPWYTRDSIGTWTFKTLALDVNGYPTHSPQNISDASQYPGTIWANIQAWPGGKWVCLYDGSGIINFSGNCSNVTKASGRNKITFDISNPVQGSFLAMEIVKSDKANPIRNIRVIMPGHEFTYQTQPFNPRFLNHVKNFSTLRFMDWGATNNWGCIEGDGNCVRDTTVIHSWSERAKVNACTWSDFGRVLKGVPYEVMINLCNTIQKDMWVCVPHNVNAAYVDSMAALIKNKLSPGLKVYVEYSNEIWNPWFGQFLWLFEKNPTFPQHSIPYIQQTFDVFSKVFAKDMNRLVRVVGVHPGWVAAGKTVISGLKPGSVDAFATNGYFGGPIRDAVDTILASMAGAFSTTGPLMQAIDYYTRNGLGGPGEGWNGSLNNIRAYKKDVSDALGIPMLVYEGGQHMTSLGFGYVSPTNPIHQYVQALEDLQRDPLMYNLYADWFDSLRTVVDDELLFMNFTLATSVSGQYGSWGILESINQDFSVLPAPKYKAVMDEIALKNSCNASTVSFAAINNVEHNKMVNVYPNPSNEFVFVDLKSNTGNNRLVIRDINARLINEIVIGDHQVQKINISNLAAGVYLVSVMDVNNNTIYYNKLIKQ